MDLEFAPLGNSPREADAFVRAEIERSLPPGWHVTGLDQHSPLSGTILPDDDPDGGYGVKISRTLDLLVFTWGNGYPGPGTMEHAMSTAIILEIPFLKTAIPHCVRRLLNEFSQNSYGLT
jgi:hypothetical protein